MSEITVTNAKFSDAEIRRALTLFLDRNMRYGGTLAECLAIAYPEMSREDIVELQAAIVEWVDYVDRVAPPMSFVNA